MLGYRIARGILIGYTKLFYRVKVIGKENQIKEGGCVIIANHSSLFDPIAVAVAIKRDIKFLAKSDLEKHAILRWLFKRFGVVSINRGASDMVALRKVCEIVSGGDVTGIFPQGTRIECATPDIETALPGIGLIAGRAKVPILPVAICYGKKNKKPKLFRKLRVAIGEPIPYEEYGFINGEKANSHEIAKYAFGKVCKAFEENNI